MTKTYTDDELIRRVWDVEEIKKVAYKRVYFLANEWRQKELDELWVSDPEAKKTASLGSNTGFYVGMDSIRDYYVTRRGDHTVGCLSHYPVSTGLVELAGDGQTAKGLWYCIGQETTPNGDGTAKAMWITGKVAIDFRKEGDSWKIWHLVLANDLSSEAGEDYAKGEPYWDPETDPVAREFGTPDVAVLTHDPNFNWWDDYPSMPQPYETFTDDISYGPEGFKPPRNKGFNVKEGRNYK